MSNAFRGLRHSIPTEDAVLDLIQRLEAAEAGSRELDRDLAKLIDVAVWQKCANWASQPCGAPPDVIDRDALRWLPDYTTSLDAALALAERLGLDGWKTLYGAMMHWKSHDPRGPLSRELPIALCIAILKATTASAVGISEASAEEMNPLPHPSSPQGEQT